MRSTADLIDEVEAEATNFTNAAIVVAFEDTTVYVFATDEDRLDKLNNAVESGGVYVEPYRYISRLLSVPLAQSIQQDGRHLLTADD
jgi:hypothetical protein